MDICEAESWLGSYQVFARGKLAAAKGTCFKNGVPSYGWWRGFKHRHQNVVLRAAENLEQMRAAAVVRSKVEPFFRNLQATYDDGNYSANRIWNMDESGVVAFDKDRGCRVLARRGSRRVDMLACNQRERLTIVATISAAGVSIPNFYIFKGQRRRENWMEQCESGASYAAQENGWMTSEIFVEYLQHLVLSIPGGVSVNNGIDIVRFPAHTSHRLQPLDVGCFGPFKAAFNRLRTKIMQERRQCYITKEDLAGLASNAMATALSESNILGAFRGSGIWPLNPAVVADAYNVGEQFEVHLPDSNTAAALGAQGGNEDHADAAAAPVPRAHRSALEHIINGNLSQVDDDEVIVPATQGTGILSQADDDAVLVPATQGLELDSEYPGVGDHIIDKSKEINNARQLELDELGDDFDHDLLDNDEDVVQVVDLAGIGGELAGFSQGDQYLNPRRYINLTEGTYAEMEDSAVAVREAAGDRSTEALFASLLSVPTPATQQPKRKRAVDEAIPHPGRTMARSEYVTDLWDREAVKDAQVQAAAEKRLRREQQKREKEAEKLAKKQAAVEKLRQREMKRLEAEAAKKANMEARSAKEAAAEETRLRRKAEKDAEKLAIIEEVRRQFNDRVE